MKIEDIDPSLVKFAEEEYSDATTSGQEYLPHEAELLERHRRLEELFSTELMPHEVEMLRRRRRLEELFSQPRSQEGGPSVIRGRTGAAEPPPAQPNERPSHAGLEPLKASKPKRSEPPKAGESRHLIIVPKEPQLPTSDVNQPTLPTPKDDRPEIPIDLGPKVFTLRDFRPKAAIARRFAACLLAGSMLLFAAFAFPPTRRMIFNLIAGEPEKAEAPLIPASNSPEAKRLRKHIDDLRIPAGAFSDCYRLQANDNRVNWYFDNMGLIASCQSNPEWVRAYLARYLSNVDLRTGMILDVQDITTGMLQPSDSDGAYAATMLSLAAKWHRTTEKQWTIDELTQLKQIARKTILGLQQPNGLVRGSVNSQAAPVYRLMDNCEIYRGLADFSMMLASAGDAEAKEFDDAARRVAAGIAELYDEQVKAFRVADIGFDQTFYPYRGAQIYPEVCGVPLGDRARTAERYEAAWNFMNATGDRWMEGEDKDGSLKGYPWMILGLAAAKHGKPELARAQLAFFSRRLNERTDPKFTAIHELGWAVQIIDLLEYKENSH
jgi:hypothetical protein